MTAPIGAYIAKEDGYWWSGNYQGPSWQDFEPNFTEPTALNTGPRPGRPAMTVVNGDLTITVDGTVVQDKDVYGRIFIRANDVTVSDCIIRGRSRGTTDGALVDCLATGSGSGTKSGNVVQFCEIFQQPAYDWFWMNGISGTGYRAHRNHIHGTTDFFGVQNKYNNNGPSNVIIEYNYCHDLSYWYRDAAMAASGDGLGVKEPHSDNHTHNDGIQLHGNGGTIIRGNAFFGAQSTTLGNGWKPLVRIVTSAAGETPVTYNVPNAYTGQLTSSGGNGIYNPWAPNVTGSGIVSTPTTTVGGSSYDNLIEYNWLYGFARQIVIAAGTTYGGADIGIIRYNRFDSSQYRPNSARLAINTAHTATVIGNYDINTGAAVVRQNISE